MKKLRTRFKVALALDGHGANVRLAIRLDTTPDKLCHVSYGTHSSRRVREGIEAFIVEMYKKHAALLCLEGEE